MVTDPIADFITRLQNAGKAGHEGLEMPYSSLKHEVAKILEREGFLTSVNEKGKTPKQKLEVGVKYTNDASPRIHEAKRLSKPSRRLYVKAKEIRPHKYGHGVAVLSTPLGLLTDREAREKNVGGEILFTIW